MPCATLSAILKRGLCYLRDMKEWNSVTHPYPLSTSREGNYDGVICSAINVLPLRGYTSLRSLIDCHSLPDLVIQAGISDGMCGGFSPRSLRFLFYCMLITPAP
jgi:hypothetical protein